MNTFNICVFCGKLMGILVYEGDCDCLRTCYTCGIRYYDLEGSMSTFKISGNGNGFDFVAVPIGCLLVKYEVEL